MDVPQEDHLESSKTTPKRRRRNKGMCLEDRPVLEPNAAGIDVNRFTCVTAWTSLGLRLAHVVTSMSPRLDSRWGGSFPLPGREFHPLEAPGLAWRTEVAA